MTAPERFDWVWYGVDENGDSHVSLGRWQKHPCQFRYKFADIQPTEHDHTPAAIREAWEKAYWRMRSYAVHDNDCKWNKPPRFDGPCSCGLTAALEEALALIGEARDD